MTEQTTSFPSSDNQPLLVKSSKKIGLVFYIISLLVVAVASAGGMYLWLTSIGSSTKRSITNNFDSVLVSTPVVTPTSVDLVANWKTYRDEEAGFEINYPADLTLISYNGDVYDDQGDKLQSADFKYRDLELGRETISGISYRIYSTKNKCDLSLEDPAIKSVKDVMVGRIPSKMYHFSWDGSVSDGVQLENNGKCIGFSVSHGPNYDDLWESQFINILSTFRFL